MAPSAHGAAGLSVPQLLADAASIGGTEIKRRVEELADVRTIDVCDGGDYPSEARRLALASAVYEVGKFKIFQSATLYRPGHAASARRDFSTGAASCGTRYRPAAANSTERFKITVQAVPATLPVEMEQAVSMTTINSGNAYRYVTQVLLQKGDVAVVIAVGDTDPSKAAYVAGVAANEIGRHVLRTCGTCRAAVFGAEAIS